MAQVNFNQLPELSGAIASGDVFAFQSENGDTKKIRASVLANELVKIFATSGGAGLHNSLFRGKNLGNTMTATQKAQISAGTFNDLWIGDFWTINGVNWRIAHFDYWLNDGDTPCNTHHIVIVPDSNLYNAQMHNTDSGDYVAGDVANTTAGAYAGSDMCTKNLEKAKTQIKAAFPDMVLTVRRHFQNAVTSGYPSAGTWYDSEVDLMTERMVYGNSAFANHTALGGTTIPNLYNVDYEQLALFRLAKQFICNRAWYWLQDVVSAAGFALVGGDGGSNFYGASSSVGVRPAFAIHG